MISAIQSHTPSFTPRLFLKVALIVALALAILFVPFSPPGPITFKLSKGTRAYQEEAQCYNSGVHIVPEPYALATTSVALETVATWSHALHPFPALPTKRNCINHAEVERFNSHTRGSVEAYYTRKLLNATLTVSHAHFEALLSHAAKDFTNYLETLPPAEQDYVIVIPKRNKSEEWVTQLSLKYLSRFPVNVTLLDNVYTTLQSHPGVDRIAIFDDAAYSCVNAGLNLAALDTVLRRPLKFHLVIPFVSAKECFYEAGGTFFFPQGSQAEHFQVHTALEFGKDLDTRFLYENAPLRLLARVNLYKPLSPKYALVFDHKFADSQSTPHSGYFIYLNGFFYAFVSDPVPPYKSLEEHNAATPALQGGHVDALTDFLFSGP